MQTQTILGAWREFAKINAETVARLAGVPVDTYTALEAGALVPMPILRAPWNSVSCEVPCRIPAVSLRSDAEQYGPSEETFILLPGLREGKVAGQQRRVA
jgi:hypothetical protein